MQSIADKSNIREAKYPEHCFIFISISGNILFTNSSSPWQQGRVLPSCRWKGTGRLHHAKGTAALPTHGGKLVKLGTVEYLPFCRPNKGTAGKEESGRLSPVWVSATAWQELLCACRGDWKKMRSQVQIQPMLSRILLHFFPAKLWDDLLYG